jgi:hypothetical protein
MNATLNGHACERLSAATYEPSDSDSDAEREPVKLPTVYDRVLLGLRDYRDNRRALNRVLNLCHGRDVLPTDLVERRVGEQIERNLVQFIAGIAATA